MMPPAKQFKYTLDQPLAPNIPGRMLARKQQTFTDPGIFEQEMTNIFDNDWVMVGRSGAIPNPGDYITAFLGQRPIIVMRQQDGSVRTMANYCLHRYVKLLEGCGSTNSIVCPYHCWVYKLDGELVGVPEREGFKPDDIDGLALETLATDEYLGYIFVSLQPDLQPVSERLKNLGPILKNFELERYQDRHVVHEEHWNANWKLIYHNFIESYHTTYTHKKSIGPTNPTKAVEYGSPIGDPNFTIHSNSYTDEHQPDIYNPQLEEEEFRRFYVIGVFPNGLIAIDPNFVWWMALEPKSVDQTNARWGLSFSHHAMQAMAEPEKFVEEIVNVINVATTEDKEMVEGMQAGANFGSDRPGLLHAPLEVYIKEFDDYVMRLSGE
ncbi:MAG: aromatic ring-hydroxylating dioxygenase subunit alpha [Cyanobacteria bacterium P01_C01_bin.118]